MKVMIVDDSRAMRLLIKRSLRQAGYESIDVCEAENGAQALEMVRKEFPDAILCDWNMPEMTGIEFLRRFRDAGHKTPFVFITTEFTPAKRQEARLAGATALLSKPLQMAEMKLALDPILL
jgi:two-component system chemotaxis response regulator CheY